jgi:hypothetical protein
MHNPGCLSCADCPRCTLLPVVTAAFASLQRRNDETDAEHDKFHHLQARYGAATAAAEADAEEAEGSDCSTATVEAAVAAEAAEPARSASAMPQKCLRDSCLLCEAYSVAAIISTPPLPLSLSPSLLQVLRSDRDAAEEAAFHAAAAAATAATGKKGAAGGSGRQKQPAAGAVYRPRSKFAFYVAAAWGRIGSSNPGRQLLEFRSAEEGASNIQTDSCRGGAAGRHWSCWGTHAQQLAALRLLAPRGTARSALPRQPCTSRASHVSLSPPLPFPPLPSPLPCGAQRSRVSAPSIVTRRAASPSPAAGPRPPQARRRVHPAAAAAAAPAALQRRRPCITWTICRHRQPCALPLGWAAQGCPAAAGLPSSPRLLLEEQRQGAAPPPLRRGAQRSVPPPPPPAAASAAAAVVAARRLQAASASAEEEAAAEPMTRQGRRRRCWARSASERRRSKARAAARARTRAGARARGSKPASHLTQPPLPQHLRLLPLATAKHRAAPAALTAPPPLLLQLL